MLTSQSGSSQRSQLKGLIAAPWGDTKYHQPFKSIHDHLNMQHTLTPFLIRAPSKTEGWGGEGRDRQKERKREGAALCLGVGEEKEGTLVALISGQVGPGAALHGETTLALGWDKPSRKEGTRIRGGTATSPTCEYALRTCACNKPRQGRAQSEAAPRSLKIYRACVDYRGTCAK